MISQGNGGHDKNGIESGELVRRVVVIQNLCTDCLSYVVISNKPAPKVFAVCNAYIIFVGMYNSAIHVQFLVLLIEAVIGHEFG